MRFVLLQAAAEALRTFGYTVYVKTCDTSDWESVRLLAEFAASLVMIKNAINSAAFLRVWRKRK